MRSDKQLKYGIILNYIQMFLNIIINLIYMPIMIHVLGDTQYGIYNLAASIISYLHLLSLGLGSSYFRFYSIRKSKQDEDAIAKLNGLYLSVFVFIGIVAFTSGMFIANNVGAFFNSKYTSSDIELAKTLMCFLSINLAVSFPASVFTSYISSQERFVYQKLINMGRTILSPCLCIAVLFLGYGSIGMVITTTVVSIIVDFTNVFFCLHKLGMRFRFGKIDFSLLRELIVFSAFIAISQIVDQINWQTDKVVLGIMMEPMAVSIYTVASTINTMYLSFSTAVSSVFAPRINLIVSSNASDMNRKLNDIFVRVGRIQFFVLGLILSGFIFFGKIFISLWAGSGYTDAYYIALFLIVPVTVPLIQNVGVEIQIASNKHKFRSIIYLIMALLNVGISILLCRIWGVIGVAAGTAISLIIANIFAMNIYYQKKMNIDVLSFWKSIFSILPSLLIPIALGVAICIFYTFTNIISYLCLIVVYTCVYSVSVYFWGLNQKEREYILKIVKKREKKAYVNEKYNNK